MKVNVADGSPRCTVSGTARPRYPVIEVTPGAYRGGATTNSLPRCSAPITPR